jgi:hypothetical protein
LAIRRKIEFIIAIHTIFFALSYGQSPSVGTVCAESRHQYGVDGMPGSTFAWAVEQNSDGGGMIVSGEIMIPYLLNGDMLPESI